MTQCDACGRMFNRTPGRHPRCPYCDFSTATPDPKPQSDRRPHDDEWEPLRAHHHRVEGVVVEETGGQWRKRHPHDEEGEQDD